jgi:hypothetical protein
VTELLGALLTALALPLVFWWLGSRYPAPQLLEQGPSLAELAPKYRKWEFVIVALYMALWAPVSAAIWYPLHLVTRARAEDMREDAEALVFFMDGAALWLPAFFMALLVAGLLIDPAVKALLGQRHAEFERYYALRFGFDQRRVLKGFAIVVCTGFALGVFALLDAYCVASDRGLRVNALIGLERRYAYADIAEIVTAPAFIAPNGNLVQKRFHLFKFRDGTTYSTRNLPEHEIGGRDGAALAQAVIRRSGLKPVEKAVFENGEL